MGNQNSFLWLQVFAWQYLKLWIIKYFWKQVADNMHKYDMKASYNYNMMKCILKWVKLQSFAIIIYMSQWFYPILNFLQIITYIFISMIFLTINIFAKFKKKRRIWLKSETTTKITKMRKSIAFLENIGFTLLHTKV